MPSLSQLKSDMEINTRGEVFDNIESIHHEVFSYFNCVFTATKKNS